MQSTHSLGKLLLFSIIAMITAQNNSAVPDSDPDWSYDNPNAWGDNYPQCNGIRQSPINLNSKTAIVSAAILPLHFENYDVPLRGNLTVTNNGYSAKIDIPTLYNGGRPTISGGKLPNRFEAVSLHFHWGSSHKKGSEHLIDGERYDVELHIVHQNLKYKTFEEAIKHEDGLSVLGIFIEKDDQPPHNYPGLYKILKKLPEIVPFESEADITYGFSLDNILGDLYTKEFYTYNGALTTPPCSEAVIWIVFPDYLPIRTADINNFFKLRGPGNTSLINNYRPEQDLNGRTVFYRSNT